MKHTGLMIVILGFVGVATLLFDPGQAQRPGSQNTGVAGRQVASPRLAVEKTVPTQQRINRYFHGDIVPKLKNCWSGVQGKGKIELKYTYANSGGRWVLDRVEGGPSTLPRGQEAVALRCMQDAARGSSFPMDSGETSQSTFEVNWTWPVPFPTNADKLTSTMFAARLNNSGGGGSGGCDGAGTKAKCYNCSKDGHACETVCVGYKTCAVTYPGALCGASGSCASGGPFGVTGGVIMY